MGNVLIVKNNDIRLYLQSGNVDGRENDVIIFEKRKILIRAITDYIAGMTDGYALEEFEKRLKIIFEEN